MNKPTETYGQSFPLDLFDLRFSVTISFVRFSRLLDCIEWKTDFRLRSDFRK